MIAVKDAISGVNGSVAQGAVSLIAFEFGAFSWKS